LLEPCLAELQHEALAKVTRTNARRIEALDGGEHLLQLGHRVDREILVLAFGGFGRLLDGLVDLDANLLERTGEISVLVDVADELLGEERLTR